MGANLGAMASGRTRIRDAEDGLPVLELDRPVTNDEVLAAIDRERGEPVGSRRIEDLPDVGSFDPRR